MVHIFLHLIFKLFLGQEVTGIFINVTLSPITCNFYSTHAFRFIHIFRDIGVKARHTVHQN